MYDATTDRTTTDLPAPLQAERIVSDARRLFGRTLSSWASDMLEHRRSGAAGASWPVASDGTGHWSRAA